MNQAQRAGLLAIGVSLAVLALWAAFAPLNGALVTTGVVKTATNRKVVQHPDGGIVKRILVRNGDSVREGQTLIELDDVKIEANQQLLQTMAMLEAVKLDRLDAEQQLSQQYKLEPTRRQMGDLLLVDKAYQRELKIFKTRRGLLDEQISNFERQSRSFAEEQRALAGQMAASLHGAQLAKDELKLNEALVLDKFIAPVRLINLERTVADYEAKRAEHQALLAQSEQRKNDLTMRMASNRNEYQRIAAEEYKESNRQLIQLLEQLRPAQDAARRQSIVAPVSGKVVGLRLNAPGEVAPPKDALMEIVQDNEALLVEAQVHVDAIKDLRLGQSTELRFTTFNSRSTPVVKGELTYISADALPDRNGALFYVIQVGPDPVALSQAGIAALKPGMAVEVFVLLESRSTLDYLLAPITEGMRRSFREP